MAELARKGGKENKGRRKEMGRGKGGEGRGREDDGKEGKSRSEGAEDRREVGGGGEAGRNS